MKFTRHFFFIFFVLIQSLNANAQVMRGMYVNDFDVILGNTQKEDSLLSYLRDSSFNYMALYDLGSLDYTNTAEMNLLSSFILKARQSYGIPYVGAVGETKSFFTSNIKSYNNSRSNADEKFNVFNVEFEFWTVASVQPGGYYCQKYLQQANCDCDTSGAFKFYKGLLHSVDSFAATQGAISETYIGWFNQGQGQQIQSSVDRILLHAYRVDNSSVWSYSKTRLGYLAANHQPVNVAPIFSSEPDFMGPWLQEHGQNEAYDKYLNDFNNDNSSWKQYINLQGFQWFNYGFMPKQTPNGNAASIAASGATSFCQGGMVTLTATQGTAYLWSNGATTRSINATQGGNYSCQVTANSTTQTTNSIHVTVYAAPTVSVIVNSPVSNTVPLSSTNDPGSGSITSYQWKLNNASLGGANTSTYVATQTGDYTLVATNSYGCSNVSDAAEVIVPSSNCVLSVPDGATTTNITSTAATLHWDPISAADSIIIRFKVETATAYSYIRLVYTGQTSYQLTGLSATTEYSWRIKMVCGTSSGNYSTKKYFTTAAATGIAESEQIPTGVMIYPNPATSIVHVTVTCPQPQLTTMMVYDITGKMVLTEQGCMTEGENTIDIDASAYGKGMYILSLQTEKETIQKKISIE